MGRQSQHERQHESEYTFSRAAWDAVEDARLSNYVSTHVMLVPMAQKGVWHVVVEARSTLDGEKGAVVARHSGSYPNGRALTFSAFLFQLMNSVIQMVEARRQDDYRRTLESA